MKKNLYKVIKSAILIVSLLGSMLLMPQEAKADAGNGVNIYLDSLYQGGVGASVQVSIPLDAPDDYKIVFGVKNEVAGFLATGDFFDKSIGYGCKIMNLGDTVEIMIGEFSSTNSFTASAPRGSTIVCTYTGVEDRSAQEYSDNAHIFYFTYIPPKSAPQPMHVHDLVEGVIYEPTCDKDGLEGTYCRTCGAVIESHPISAMAYTLNDYATPMINASKPGQAITFEFGEWNSFPKAFMEKLVDKSAQGVTFVFHYKWNHQKQEITIPAGTPIDLNFDYYGPAKMAELYGMY